LSQKNVPIIERRDDADEIAELAAATKAAVTVSSTSTSSKSAPSKKGGKGGAKLVKAKVVAPPPTIDNDNDNDSNDDGNHVTETKESKSSSTTLSTNGGDNGNGNLIDETEDGDNTEETSISCTDIVPDPEDGGVALPLTEEEGAEEKQAVAAAEISRAVKALDAPVSPDMAAYCAKLLNEVDQSFLIHHSVHLSFASYNCVNEMMEYWIID
jgi:hypothetical protein